LEVLPANSTRSFFKPSGLRNDDYNFDSKHGLIQRERRAAWRDAAASGLDAVAAAGSLRSIKE
jgi:hypothetical protein